MVKTKQAASGTDRVKSVLIPEMVLNFIPADIKYLLGKSMSRGERQRMQACRHFHTSNKAPFVTSVGL